MLAQGGGLKGAALGAIFDKDVRHGKTRQLSVEQDGHVLSLAITNNRVGIRWQFQDQTIVDLQLLPPVAQVSTSIEEANEALILGFSGGDALRVQVRPTISLNWEHQNAQLLGKPQVPAAAEAVSA